MREGDVARGEMVFGVGKGMVGFGVGPGLGVGVGMGEETGRVALTDVVVNQ
jgi:hypothetical protein